MNYFIKRLLAGGAATALLAGCASGPQYRTPEVRNDELQQVRIPATAPAKIARTQAEDIQILKQVSQRLRAGAEPVCKDAKIDCSAIKIMYNPGDVVNAFASQAIDQRTGQKVNQITIFRGLMQYMDEAQIANVVGHEMGHHIGRHNEDTQRRAQLGGFAGILGGAILSGGNREITQLGGQLGQMGAVLSYSKDQERQADVIGAYIINNAGYDLQAAGQAWITLARLQNAAKAGAGVAASGMFATHPSSGERAVAWDKTSIEVKASTTGLPPRTDRPAP